MLVLVNVKCKRQRIRGSPSGLIPTVDRVGSSTVRMGGNPHFHLKEVEMFKHKFKVGDKVTVNGKAGVIFTLGHAESVGRNFTICDSSKTTETVELIGYQVNFGNQVKIVKESDINKL